MIIYSNHRKNYKPHGFGLLIKSDLARYFGRFKHGLMNGRFYKRDANGKVYKQNYQRGELIKEDIELKHTNFFEILNTDTLDYKNLSNSLTELLNKKDLNGNPRKITLLTNLQSKLDGGNQSETARFESYLNDLYTKIKTYKEIPSLNSNHRRSSRNWRHSLGSRRQFLEDEKMGYIVAASPEEWNEMSRCSLGKDQTSPGPSCEGSTGKPRRCRTKQNISSVSEDGLKKSLKTRQFSFKNPKRFVSDCSENGSFSTEGKNPVVVMEKSDEEKMTRKAPGIKKGKIRKKRFSRKKDKIAKMEEKLKDFGQGIESRIERDKKAYFREIFSGLFKAGVGERMLSEGAEVCGDSMGDLDEEKEGIGKTGHLVNRKSREWKSMIFILIIIILYFLLSSNYFILFEENLVNLFLFFIF